jgi:putative ABC transport system substrate-binding protein
VRLCRSHKIRRAGVRGRARIFAAAVTAETGGNLTGINFLTGELAAKQLELLRELVPAAARVAALVNPANAANTETTLRDVEPAARAIGLQIQVLNASTSREIDVAFATFVRERPDAVFVSGDAFFNSRRVQLALLAGRHGVPAIYSGRESAEAGGLISYGSNITDAYRQMGVYAGRILKGTKPADLPVERSTKFELVINLQTARLLNLEVPPMLLARAERATLGTAPTLRAKDRCGWRSPHKPPLRTRARPTFIVGAIA